MAIIRPNIYANLVREKYVGKAVMRNFAIDVDVDGTQIQNSQVGGTVIFPKFKTLGEAQEMTAEGFTELTSESLDQTSSSATVKQTGKSVFIKDYDNVTALGNFIQEAADQTGIVIARKVDSDLIAECLTSPLKSATAAANAITHTELQTGGWIKLLTENNQNQIYLDPEKGIQISKNGEKTFYLDTDGNAIFKGNINASTITGSAVNGGTIIGSTIIGGNISSNSTINITTDATVGSKLYIKTNDYNDGIYFNTFADQTSITVRLKVYNN